MICATSLGGSTVASHAAPLAHEPKCDAIHVELDVFSGRENPAWDLDVAQGAELSRLFSTLTPSALAKQRANTLGYRGFLVTCFHEYDVITVYHSNIEALHERGYRRWDDPGRTLERFLLESARQHIDSELYRAITNSMDVFSDLTLLDVRREKARSLSGKTDPPATVAPAGSYRSGRGGNETTVA